MRVIGKSCDEGGRRRSRHAADAPPLAAVHLHHGYAAVAVHGHAHGRGGDGVGAAVVATVAAAVGGGDGGGSVWPRAPARCGALLGPDELLRGDGLGVAPEAEAAGADVASAVDVPVTVPAAQAVDALAALCHVAHAGAHAPPAVHAPAHLV